jgi:TonB family protein
MIGVVLFLFVASAVVAIAAWTAEEGLRRCGVSTRWIWLASLLAPPLLLVGPAVLPDRSEGLVERAIGAAPVVELSPLVVGAGGGGLPLLELATVTVWLLASLGMVALLVRTQRGLSRERAGWPVSSVSGRKVYLSEDRGPAVAGVLRPWIVLPRWTLGLSEQELRLVVLHEEEHLRARDSVLLACALALIVLTPWNPISWWQLRRLRTAMEVDCDRRVLRREPDRGLYGSSLLTVAARASGHSLGFAAFTEKPSSLETRIVAMTPNRSPWARARAALFVLLATVVGIQACGVENPTSSIEPRTSEVELPRAPETTSAEITAAPTFTPFTDPPQIVNRDEVVEAMESSYPPLLRDAGITGRVVLYFFIDETGEVQNVLIQESSGHPALDDAALRVASVYRFAPAMNRDQAVPVWVQFPITFQTAPRG